MFSCLAQAPVPSSDEIRRIAAEVVARDYFRIDEARDASEPPLWLVIFKWIIKPFVALFELLDGLPDVLRWLIVIGAVILCIALIAHITYVLMAAVRGPGAGSRKGYTPPETKLDPQSLERSARERERDGDYIGAIRLLMRAATRRLEIAEERPFRPGVTNRQVLRRYQATPLFEPLKILVEVIDRKWYGGEPCTETDYAICQQQHALIRDYAQARRRPVAA
ncbi:MAG TPA: DUF4129 domain-containing protein [Lacipirellula sp.]